MIDVRALPLGRCDLCHCKVWQRADGSERNRSGADHHHRKEYKIISDEPGPVADRDWHWVAPGYNRSWS